MLMIIKTQTLITLLIAAASVNTSCKKQHSETVQLQGTFVEKDMKSDTIVFLDKSDGEQLSFELKRSKRTADGITLPGYYSGPYWYSIGGNNISVLWFLSSGMAHNYYFKSITADEFSIGNFFKDPQHPEAEKDTLIFVKAGK